MKKQNLNFCFKGNRTYIHGTDIYNNLFDYIKNIKSEISSIDLSFHGIANNNLEISVPTFGADKCRFYFIF